MQISHDETKVLLRRGRFEGEKCQRPGERKRTASPCGKNSNPLWWPRRQGHPSLPSNFLPHSGLPDLGQEEWVSEKEERCEVTNLS